MCNIRLGYVTASVILAGACLQLPQYRVTWPACLRPPFVYFIAIDSFRRHLIFICLKLQNHHVCNFNGYHTGDVNAEALLPPP